MQTGKDFLTFIHHGIAKENFIDKTNFGRQFRRLCRNYGIEVCHVSAKNVFDSGRTLSEPFVVSANCSVAFYKKLNSLLPRYRLILMSDCTEKIHGRMSMVCPDTWQIARELTMYLAEAGRKRLALFAFDRYAVDTGQYVKAFEEAAKQTDCCFGEADMFLNDENLLSDCTSRLIAGIDRYDAVFCANDMAALHLITELKKHGLRVPEDVFVIGRGNSQIARAALPSITSVDLMNGVQAEQCVAVWRYLKKYPDVMRAKITINHSLLIRESTANFRPVTEWRDELPSPHKRGADRGYGVLERLNLFFETADAADRIILQNIAAGKVYEEIGKDIFLTESAVKYRVKKMLHHFGVQHRSELLEILREYHIGL